MTVAKNVTCGGDWISAAGASLSGTSTDIRFVDTGVAAVAGGLGLRCKSE